MPRVGEATWDEEDSALRARTVARLREMALGCYAPSQNEWALDCRTSVLPGVAWIKDHWTWAALVEEAGLEMRQPKSAYGMTSPLNRALSHDERQAMHNRTLELERLMALSTGLTVCDRPPRVLSREIVRVGGVLVQRTLLAYEVR